MHDLAVIVVSTNERHWLERCLPTVFDRAGSLQLEVVVADNESSDGTAGFVESFPGARVVRCRNRGFGHANNRALATCNARWVLFLNPDTEIVEGSLAELVDLLDRRPEIGLASVTQLTADGDVYPTIHWFPNALRVLGQAFGADRLKTAPSWVRERERDPKAYQREVSCDWLTGAFMAVRREAIASAGMFDERFFMSSEETDLACRIKQAGWAVIHLPSMTIVHHVHAGEQLGERMHAQYAYARVQYARKHFSPLHRFAYRSALCVGHAMRAAGWTIVRRDPERRAAERAALGTVLGRRPAPYGPTPPTAVQPLDATEPFTADSPRDLTMRAGAPAAIE
jgi:GT2 family glycosyltransferase